MQSAYRKKHSTETAILKIHNDILRAMDRGECTILVMLDLSAAFDTVDHNILLKRLRGHFGIEGNCHAWIKSYLFERVQQVLIGSNLSSEKVMGYNIPQGSILGPDEYSDFTAPVGNVVRAHSIQPHFYADDSQLYKHFKANICDSIQNAIDSLENGCASIQSWMNSNLLKLNEDKTELMIIGSKRRLKSVNVSSLDIGGSKITPTTSAVNIGVTLDCNMSMEMQVNKIVSAAWYHLHNIFTIRKYLTQSATETIIHAFVTSKLDLNNGLLYGISKKQVKKLQKVQNAAARIVVKSGRYDSAKPILKNLTLASSKTMY